MLAGVSCVVQSTNGEALTWVGCDSLPLSVTAQQKFGKTPLLVDDEMEAQYKRVYKRAMQGNDSSAQINLVSARASPPDTSAYCSPACKHRRCSVAWPGLHWHAVGQPSCNLPTISKAQTLREAPAGGLLHGWMPPPPVHCIGDVCVAEAAGNGLLSMAQG